jgi:hypothetical protein
MRHALLNRSAGERLNDSVPCTLLARSAKCATPLYATFSEPVASSGTLACICFRTPRCLYQLCGSSRVALHFLYLVAFMRASTGSDIKTVSSRVVVAVVVVADIR